MVDVSSPSSDKGRLVLQRLSSLPLSAGIMAALIAWLSLGLILAHHPVTDAAVQQMNDRLLLYWLLHNSREHWLLSLWLGGLFILSGFLLVNLIGCSLTMLLPRLRVRRDRKSFLSLLLHVLLGVVMIGHGANLVVGFKTAYHKLLPEQSLSLPDGRAIRLEAVTYLSSRELLAMDHHQGRQKMTRARMGLKTNSADFSLHKNGQSVAAGRAFLLQPFRYGSLRITINRFFLAAGDAETAPVGVIVTVAANPIHEVFFLVYALMIASFLAYTVVSARNDLSGDPAGPLRGGNAG